MCDSALRLAAFQQFPHIFIKLGSELRMACSRRLSFKASMDTLHATIAPNEYRGRIGAEVLKLRQFLFDFAVFRRPCQQQRIRDTVTPREDAERLLKQAR